MAAPPLGHRLQGLFWEFNPPVRRRLRSLRRSLSLALHRARRLVTPGAGPRVVPVPAKGPAPKVSDPPLTLARISHQLSDELPAQTPDFGSRGHFAGATPAPPKAESHGGAGVPPARCRSGTKDPTIQSPPFEGGFDASFIAPGNGLAGLPENHLEAMLMAAAAENLSWVAAGWAPPAPGRFGPSGVVLRDPETPESAHLLLRRPTSATAQRAPVVGRVLPYITSAQRCDGLTPIADHTPAAGPYRIRPDMARAAVVECPWFPVDEVLAEMPAVDGPPTALFLLPFLAVGGAERLLFELMEGLRERYRLLVVTTDPHIESLGQTVDQARELTPHVYTLGDWLPRDVVASALRYLIRRWRVQSLVCWNGSITFYDEVAALRQAFPQLRIVNQLFNHHGGWIEHFSPSLIQTVDTQIAVNTPIARALVAQRGVPDDRVVTIHHAVSSPRPRDEDRRARLRRELGVDDDTVVVGSFIRMHPQKRPLDIIRLARRMADDKVHFFLVGGGPLDDAVDREIARNPLPNLTRWPLQSDASPLYDAIDLCLMTSDFEGLPVFLLDGLARGIPCVATAVGDIPLLLRDGGGLIIDRPGDLDALATAIRAYLDLERRRTEGDKGRTAVATRFGLERYVEAYEAVMFPKAGGTQDNYEL